MFSIQQLPYGFNNALSYYVLTLAFIVESWKLQLQSIDIEGVNG